MIRRLFLSCLVTLAIAALGLLLAPLVTAPLSAQPASFTPTNVALMVNNKRIYGDFSNATLTDRYLFQSGTTNGETSIGAVPNGSGTDSSFNAFSAADPTNAAYVGLGLTGSIAYLASNKTGSGTARPLGFYIDNTPYAFLRTNGDFLLTNSPTNLTVAGAGLTGRGFYVQHNSATASYRGYEADSSPNVTFEGDVSGGTMSAPTATPNASNVFMRMNTYDGTSWDTSGVAQFTLGTTQQHTPTAKGTYGSIRTTASGTTYPVDSFFSDGQVTTFNTNVSGVVGERARISSAGNFLVGTPSDTGLTGSGNAKVAGSVYMSGSAKRFLGDFSNATHANRVHFKTSTTDGNTVVGAVPNGTSTIAGYRVYGDSDPDNSTSGIFYANGGIPGVVLESKKFGTGILGPLIFAVEGVIDARLSTSGNFLLGTTSDAELSGVGNLKVFGDIVAGGNLRTATQTPASASATGTAGTITWDSSYVYVCVGTNTWKRAPLGSW